jgi:hypothetical protein
MTSIPYRPTGAPTGQPTSQPTLSTGAITTSTWSTVMKQYHYQGSYYISTTDKGSSSAVMQLASSSYGSNSNSIYAWQRIMTASSGGGGFQLSFEGKISTSSTADGIFVFFGTSSIPENQGTSSIGSGILIGFDIYNSKIELRKSTSGTNSQLTQYTSYSSAKSGNWESYTITYSADTTNTWKVDDLITKHLSGRSA